jgi:hypothetical protein
VRDCTFVLVSRHAKRFCVPSGCTVLPYIISRTTRFCEKKIIECNMCLDVARMVEERGVHRVLVGKSEGKRLLGRPRRRWEDNIKWILRWL